MVMGVIGWMVLGLTAGYAATSLVSKRGEGLRLNIALGVFGALLGGWLFGVLRATAATGFNVWSLPAAGIGAVVFLVVGHFFRRPAWQG